MNETTSHIDYIIGEEKRLADIIGRAEVEPLLKSIVRAGAVNSVLFDEDRLPLAEEGSEPDIGQWQHVEHSIMVEGEPKGLLRITGKPGDMSLLPMAILLRDAVQLVVTNNLKRMMTTELHTSIVQESYEQLVAVNRSLMESERRYRHLALSLEQKVEQRTVELQNAYARLLQQEKLAAVGSLAAGMAHEINNPIGFIQSNLSTFRKYLERLVEMLGFFRLLTSKVTNPDQLKLMSDTRWRDLKLDMILDDAPELLAQSLQGAERIARIVADLKLFSHVDENEHSDADLNIELERTISVLASQIAAECTFVCELQPLPLFACSPGLISQAFLGIIQNALQSRSEGLRIKVASRVEDGDIIIDISDNGCGITPQNISRVFEPFFTTREVGLGTGMGLTVARETIIAAGGSIGIASREGEGTKVTIRLPSGKEGNG
jgi:two-component system, NtrC family, sensor kinase